MSPEAPAGKIDVEGNLAIYLGDRMPTARYASFDYCFNHFQQNRTEFASPAMMELSCLHLGFYLASWGMYRGSADLLQRSVKRLEPVVEALSAANPEAWEIDADRHTDAAMSVVLETARRLRLALGGASDTLVTKIMLGVFGCVPAFDVNVKGALGATTFGRKSLSKIARFYSAHADVIEAHGVRTLDFSTGSATDIRYTRAKVIDMALFIEGMKGQLRPQHAQPSTLRTP